MKALLSAMFILLFYFPVHSQINMEDSTVQVIGYWDNKEMQSYTVTVEKYKVVNNDTTGRELRKFDVDITIVDSTADSYTIEWYYKNYFVDTDKDFIKKLSSLFNDVRVIIKTDEMGSFLAVENWGEVKEAIKEVATKVKSEFKDMPNINLFVAEIEMMLNSKEQFEAAGIKEILQFYFFHGGKYKLGEEINATLQLSNTFGGEPFNAETTFWLDEIDLESYNSTLRMTQVLDSEQLTNETYNYLQQTLLSNKLPDRVNFPTVQNTTWTTTLVHDSGWVVYSIETKETSSDNAINIEERIIELK